MLLIICRPVSRHSGHVFVAQLPGTSVALLSLIKHMTKKFTPYSMAFRVGKVWVIPPMGTRR